MRLIADGVVEREGVPGLARHLGYSERQVRRHLLADLGAGPLALARAQRAHVARLLLETTDLPVTEVAFAAGFGSLRQFNATIREVFAAAPTALREARRPGETVAERPDRPSSGSPGAVRLAGAACASWRCVPCPASRRWSTASTVAASGSRTGRRSSSWPTTARRSAARWPWPTPATWGRPWRAVAASWTSTPTRSPWRRRWARIAFLADLVRAVPGRRSPGAVDGAELAIRAVLGQGITVAAARTLAARLVEAHGTPLAAPRAA